MCNQNPQIEEGERTNKDLLQSTAQKTKDQAITTP